MEARLIVADYSSAGTVDAPNPCVIGNAHFFLGSVFVMSEGRRGKEAGRVESRLAVSEVLTRFRSGATSEPKQRLCDALNHAGRVLFSRSQAARVFSESSAICSAVLIRGDRLYASRVGNMGLILLRKERPIVLFDHRSAVASNHAGLGQSHDVSPDVLPDPVPLMVGDRILLANAMLLNSVSEEEWSRIVGGLVPAVATRRLVEAVVRVGEMRPVSVQVIEVEEFLDERDAVLPALGTGTPVRGGEHPSGSPGHYPDDPGRLRIAKERGGWVAKTLLMLVALLVVGMVTRFVWPTWGQSSEQELSPPTPAVPVTLDGAQVEHTDPKADTQQPFSFWEALATKLTAGAIPTDSDTLGQLVAGPEDLHRRLREAQALTAGLQTLVKQEEQRTPSSDGAKAPVDEGEAPVSSASKEPRWDPEKLPRNLRGFEQIFSQPDPVEAAQRLRRYVASRHRIASRVLKLLDVYVKRAPKERSLRVLEHLSEVRPRPGPRTRKWARRAKRWLRIAIKNEQPNSAETDE